MQFENPIYLVPGLAACVGLVWLYLRLRKSRLNLLQQFASSHLVERLTASVSPRRRNVKFILLVAACACIFVALARPQAGFRWEEAQRQGIDILMAVDTSKSMLAEDVQPNRLERAKLGILDFVSKLDGDRVGLIPFSGSSFLLCPLTLDYDAFGQSLKALDTALMPRVGTDIASAIHEAEAAFAKDANHRILVLITDGEDLEGEALAAAKAAAKRGITIHTVGVGTPAGELIPASLSGGFVKDEQGQVVKSRLDEDMLRQIAEVTGGTYEPLGAQAEGLEAIYREKLSLVPKEEIAERMRKVPLERFAWPLWLALLLLAMEYVLSDRRRIRQSARTVVTTADRRPARRPSLAGAAAAAMMMLLALGARNADASPQDAEVAYEQGDYATATEQYQKALGESPDDPTLQFNTGAAAYQMGDFAAAASAFEGVVGAEDLALQSQAYYNLGNTLYRQGQQTEQSNPQQTIQHWEQALTSYEGTLALNSGDADAQYNHDLVKRRLEELKQQQEQQQQEQQQKQEQCENPQKQDQQDQQQQDSQKGSDENNEQQQNQQDESQGGGSQANSDPNEKGEENKNNESQASASDQASDPKQQDQDSKGSSQEEKQDQPDQAPESQPDSPSNTGDEEQEAKPDKGQTGKQQPQPSAGSDEANGGEPEAAPGQPQPSQAGDETAPSGIGERRQPGQMTAEEAENLLDSLKGEDGDTPFVPMSNGGTGGQDKDPRRDW